MTARSQVEKLRRAADRAASVARENKRLDYGLEDIEIDLRYAVEKARSKVQDFRAWITAHKDELTALQVLYAGTRPLQLSLSDLRQLKECSATLKLSRTRTLSAKRRASSIRSGAFRAIK